VSPVDDAERVILGVASGQQSRADLVAWLAKSIRSAWWRRA